MANITTNNGLCQAANKKRYVLRKTPKINENTVMVLLMRKDPPARNQKPRHQ